MSKARNIRRLQERKAAKHFEYLGKLLMGFYKFLESKPKPENEAVREEFIKRDNLWKRYCKTNQLTDRATLLFNQEVAVSWENRYAKPMEETLTQK